MAERRQHLQNAPIAEAIIDFRVSRADQVMADVFSNLERAIGEQYSAKSPIRLYQGYFGMDNGRFLDPSQSEIDLGWRYQRDNEVAQFRVDGFTFSKLEPYTTWEDVFTEAFRLWDVYRELVRPQQVSRLAVRYINRIQMKMGTNIEVYLESPPRPPGPSHREVKEFLTRLYVNDDTSKASAVIVQALERPVEPATGSILLDIDAFLQVALSPEDVSLRSIFEQLRNLKNDIFFASITEATVEIYA